VSSNKCLYSNQLKITTTHPQANAIIEQVLKLLSFNDMLRSIELQKNHENSEQQEDNPLDYFLQSTAFLPNY
jgi:hypothetical protein